MLRSRLSCASLQNVVQTLRSASSWATVEDPTALSGSNSAQAYNLVNGQWTLPKASKSIPCPMSGEEFIRVPNTQPEEAQPFIDSLKAVPKSGLHNPYKNPDRYVMYGDITFKVAEEMRKPEVLDFFARLIQRTSPKSYAQARGEVVVTTRFLENFCGDQVRFMARGFKVSGDHAGQSSAGLRWPYGPVGLITPFNFPLEIPVLQLMGALYMGNKPLLHVDHRVSLVIEQFVRLLHECGMPKTDVDLLHGPGTTMGHVLDHAKPRSTLFTGSQRVAEKLAADTAGKVFLEDAGFDWKILGPDVQDVDYVAWQCDQDAYACSGQKCSAQSIMFMHEAWAKSGLLERFGERAQRRSMDNLTVGPVITVTTARMLEHVDTLLKIPGAQLLWGGKELNGGDHTIPACYGAIEPTAVKVPLREMLRPGAFEAATTEVFGPLTVVTEYGADEEGLVLEACERMDAHLTAAVVSNDVRFVQRMLAGTVNGTTYVGMRGRTTGAPQNHWFGPAGDPRGAGIGTPEAIRLVWSCHREVIEDFGPVPASHPMEQS